MADDNVSNGLSEVKKPIMSVIGIFSLSDTSQSGSQPEHTDGYI